LLFRLHDRETNTHVIVRGDHVYADVDGDGKIGKGDEVSASALGPRHAALIEAARHIERFCDPRVPGVTNADGTIVSGATLNTIEQDEFESGTGTPAQRGHLAHHLSFFDAGNRGIISPADNYRGWRNLGFGRLLAVWQTVVSAALFGWRHGGTIVIATISKDRPSGATGIYGQDGNIDEQKWSQFRAAFERVARGGTLTQDEARAVLAEQVTLGVVPKGQFRSLFRVCETMNRAKTITIDEIRWLYDASLFYRAASMTDDGGRRTLSTHELNRLQT
jgi:peroxygenase